MGSAIVLTMHAYIPERNVVLFVVSNSEFVTSLLVSWVKSGT